MIKHTFIRFFLFATSITAVFGLFIFTFAKLSQIEISILDINLYIEFCLYYGVGMGLFGHVYAKNTTLCINSRSHTIEDLGNKLDRYKYRKFKVASNEIVFCSSKYHQWFYGKIYIQNQGDKITITAAKCIINKYFSNIV
ncbi:hypothetical protein [Clostridium sp.]|uniref:hypothetical protein n=1 Tax=Clostridium sp. TaxID=1506 RepID=UPI00261EB519|nr:hypothetical protein [Clostridium sp.]